MIDDREVLVFAGVRKIILVFKHDLEVIAEIKKEHDISLTKLYNSLEDMECFLKEKQGVDV